MLTVMFLAFLLHRDQHRMKLDEYDFSWMFLKKEANR